MSGELHGSSMPSCRKAALIRIVALSLMGLAALSGFALAHPPADAVVTYDAQTVDLVVAITHQVDDPATHYVKQVTVRQGDTVLVDKSYTSQPDTSSFTYRYSLPHLNASNGEITIDARCNRFGSRSGTLLMSGTPAPVSPAGAPPGPAKSPVCAFSALLAAGFVATRTLR